jgi:hypothetical protein
MYNNHNLQLHKFIRVGFLKNNLIFRKKLIHFLKKIKKIKLRNFNRIKIFMLKNLTICYRHLNYNMMRKYLIICKKVVLQLDKEAHLFNRKNLVHL